MWRPVCHWPVRTFVSRATCPRSSRSGYPSWSPRSPLETDCGEPNLTYRPMSEYFRRSVRMLCSLTPGERSRESCMPACSHRSTPPLRTLLPAALLRRRSRSWRRCGLSATAKLHGALSRGWIWVDPVCCSGGRRNATAWSRPFMWQVTRCQSCRGYCTSRLRGDDPSCRKGRSSSVIGMAEHSACPGHTTEISHAIPTCAVFERIRLVGHDASRPGTGDGGLPCIHGGTEEGGRARRLQPSPADLVGNDRARREWQDAGVEWALRGLEGAAWRLLPHRSARSRCRDLVGGPVPGRKSWHRRGPSSLAYTRVRCARA